MTASRVPGPPKHLSPASRRLWRRTVATFELEEHDTRLLLMACEALDRAAAAQRILDAEALVVTDRFGQSRPHPAVAVRQAAETNAARLLRELDLDAEPSPERRPPRGRRYRR